jgi:hypothetical protein
MDRQDISEIPVYILPIPTYRPSHLRFNVVNQSVVQISPNPVTLVAGHEEDGETKTSRHSIFSKHLLTDQLAGHPRQNVGSKAQTALRQSNQALHQSRLSAFEKRRNTGNRHSNLFRHSSQSLRASDHSIVNQLKSSTTHYNPSLSESLGCLLLGRCGSSSQRSYGPNYRLKYEPDLSRETTLVVSAPISSSRFSDGHVGGSHAARSILISPGTMLSQTASTNHSRLATPVDQQFKNSYFMFHDPELHRQFHFRPAEELGNHYPASNLDTTLSVQDHQHVFFIWNLTPRKNRSNFPHSTIRNDSEDSGQQLERDDTRYVKQLRLRRSENGEPDSYVDAVLRRVAQIIREEHIPLGGNAYSTMTKVDSVQFLHAEHHLIIFHANTQMAWQVVFSHTDDGVILEMATPVQASSQNSNARNNDRLVALSGKNGQIKVTRKVLENNDDDDNNNLTLSMRGRVYDVDGGRPQWLIQLLSRIWVDPTTMNDSSVGNDSTFRDFYFNSWMDDGWIAEPWQVVRDWHITDPVYQKKLQKMAIQEHASIQMRSTPVKELQWRVFQCTWIGVKWRSSTSAYYDKFLQKPLNARRRVLATGRTQSSSRKTRPSDAMTSRSSSNDDCLSFDVRECAFLADLKRKPMKRSTTVQQQQLSSTGREVRRSRQQSSNRQSQQSKSTIETAFALSNPSDDYVAQIEYYSAQSVPWVHVDPLTAAREFAIHVNHEWLGTFQFRKDLFIRVQDPAQPNPIYLQCSGVEEEPTVRIVDLLPSL